ncbi:MAG: fused response regulator/phosphatase [Lentisphaeraceae bacterium]|nr:fused response regulator/phosphatase [Lentisphaeraceae bacterium]
MTKSNILLIDDEPEILYALKLRLGKDFKVFTETNPYDALETLKLNGPFPVVVSDFRMPEMNGLDFLLEANKFCPETSSVLLTGQGEYNTAIEALNSGKIFKYLSKPCDTSEINSVLSDGVKMFHEKIERKHALKEYGVENRVAKIVQDQLLFTKFQPSNESVDITALSVPKSSVCGDFYEIIPHSKNCFDLVIADVMGKGLPAAIIGAAIKNSLMHQNQMLKVKSRCIPAISDIIVSLEGEVHDALVETRMFVTFLYARVNLDAMTISYVSNGHPGSLIIRQDSSEVLYLQSTHMPLGINKRDSFKPIILSLKPRDKFVFYTDGISEALVQNPQDDPIELILDCLDGEETSTSEVAQKIFDEAKLKRGVEDDMTVISMNLNESLGDQKESKFVLYKNLDEMYRLNRKVLEAPGVHDELFSVALIEAFTNIVKHTGESQQAIEVKCSVSKAGLKMVELLYEGSHFEPSEILLPDCSKQTDGFGLYLVERICHAVRYEKVGELKSKIILTSKKGEE